MTWVDEQLHSAKDGPGYAQRFRAERMVFERKSAFQDIRIFETAGFGRVLMIDGVIQTTEKDEFIYHEMIAHVPLFAHGTAKRVLIIGGGDGGVLREVLRHPVEQATVVELDRVVVDICMEHMPGLSDRAFDDPRTRLIIADGVKFMADSDETFDVIIVDSTDPIGPGEVLFTSAFYADCHRRLAAGGILVTQNGVPFLQPREVTTTARRLAPHFADVGFFLAAVPTYVGGAMTLAWATDDLAKRRLGVAELDSRHQAAGLSTRYYAADVHVASFALPPYVQSLMV